MRGWLDVLGNISQILSGIALPVVLFFLGQQYEERQRQNDAIEQLRRDLIDVGNYLTDRDTQKQQYGLEIINMMIDRGEQIPPALYNSVLNVSVSTESDATKQTASEVLARVPRLFIHIHSDAQRPSATKLVASLGDVRLKGATLVVPEVRIVDAFPKQSQLRFLKSVDQPEASELLNILKLHIPDLVLKDMSKDFDDKDSAKPRTYELWLAPTEAVN
ncbi:MAG TPA: hypothetical protein VFE34_00460 [Dongiaceae bacterium]|jgi:hypothetical protein|nr:hypothetical protein [Dongiaceae bacterium]